MSNQDPSPTGKESNGFVTAGPVQTMFQHFVQNNQLMGVTPENVGALEFLYYYASVQMYNTMVELMRSPPETMSLVTGAIKHDIDQYFTVNEKPPTSH